MSQLDLHDGSDEGKKRFKLILHAGSGEVKRSKLDLQEVKRSKLDLHDGSYEVQKVQVGLLSWVWGN